VDDYQPRPDHMIPAPYRVLSSDAVIWQTKVDFSKLLAEF
jgi:hypothetical protein